MAGLDIHNIQISQKKRQLCSKNAALFKTHISARMWHMCLQSICTWLWRGWTRDFSPILFLLQVREWVGPCRYHVTRSTRRSSPREPSKRTWATLTVMAASSMRHTCRRAKTQSIESVNISPILNKRIKIKQILSHLTRYTSRKEANIEKWVMLLSFILEIYHFSMFLFLCYEDENVIICCLLKTLLFRQLIKDTLFSSSLKYEAFIEERGGEKNSFLLKWENECGPH